MSKGILIGPQASSSAYFWEVLYFRRLRIREHLELRDQPNKLKCDDTIKE